MPASPHLLLDQPAAQPAEPVIIFPQFGSDPAEAALFEIGRALQNEGYRFTAVSPETRSTVNERPGNEEAHDLRGVFGWCRPFPPEILPARLLEALEAAAALERRPDGQLQSRIAYSSIGGQAGGALPSPLRGSRCGPLRTPDLPLHPPAAEGPGRRGPLARDRMRLRGCRAQPGGSLLLVDALRRQSARGAVRPRQCGVGGVRPCRSLLHGRRRDHPGGNFNAIIADPPAPMDSVGPWLGADGQLGIEAALRLVRAALPLLAAGGCLVLTASAPVVDGEDLLKQDLAPIFAACGLPAHYQELEVDVCGAALASPRYDRVERIARVVVLFGQPGTAEPAHGPPVSHHAARSEASA